MFRGVGLGLLILVATSALPQVVPGEYEIKAAVLQGFPRFVSWPLLPHGTGSELLIGVVGDDPFGPVLAEAMASVTHEGHPLKVRHFHWNDRLSGCHMIFVCASEVRHLTQILAGAPNTLTVADFDSFARRGGIIELRMVGNRVRFDINIAAAHRAGIHISSKLLGLAMHIYGEESIQ